MDPISTGQINQLNRRRSHRGLLSPAPVSTIVLAYFVLGESMSRDQIIGAALVLVGVVWISARR